MLAALETELKYFQTVVNSEKATLVKQTCFVIYYKLENYQTLGLFAFAFAFCFFRKNDLDR